MGKGYQARGVIRQPAAKSSESIINMSSAAVKPEIEIEKKISDSSVEIEKESKSKKRRHDDRHKKSKNHKMDKKIKKEKKEHRPKEHRKHKHSHREDDYECKVAFNPLLQIFATRISNKTRSFSPTNSAHT